MSAFYNVMISVADKIVPAKLQPIWCHPAGPKTIFFWAPIGKWILVIAGIGDMSRPVEKVSLGQSVALMCTGFVWSRFSLVIIPKNYSLSLVNSIVGLTGLYQVARIFKHHTSPKDENALPPSEETKPTS
ncbi:mitochondrial pyruvate carrier 2-like [Littorina saxatilis]|uniref:Mitochondrial pyruvate carrier n=1 Tax=Littorina saxatilis TaxID=31220 RepID=A0AAN9BMB2_9CAEN